MLFQEFDLIIMFSNDVFPIITIILPKLITYYGTLKSNCKKSGLNHWIFLPIEVILDIDPRCKEISITSSMGHFTQTKSKIFEPWFVFHSERGFSQLFVLLALNWLWNLLQTQKRMLIFHKQSLFLWNYPISLGYLINFEKNY